MRWLLLALVGCGAAPAPCCLSMNVTQPSPWCSNGRAYICAPLDQSQQPAPFCFNGTDRWRQGEELDVGSCAP